MRKKTRNIFLFWGKIKNIISSKVVSSKKNLRKFWIFLIWIFENIFFIFAETYFYIKGKKQKLKKIWKTKFLQKNVSPGKVSSNFFFFEERKKDTVKFHKKIFFLKHIFHFIWECNPMEWNRNSCKILNCMFNSVIVVCTRISNFLATFP